MDKLFETWRWYGPKDPVTLMDIKMAGAKGIVTALHHIPNGEIWTVDEIIDRKNEIESMGLVWSVVESVPVHENIKQKTNNYKTLIENYKITLQNLAECGINIVCYNFMPVLDWTRTDLQYLFEDGSRALNFNYLEYVAFDQFILKRDKSELDYTADIIEQAKAVYKNMSSDKIEVLTKNIIMGLPGAEESFDLESFRNAIGKYDNIDDKTYRTHLEWFLKEIIPVAEKIGVKMAIHPDDPPFSLFSLPRIVSNEKDIKNLLSYVDSPSNGLTFCSGSLGVNKNIDLHGIIKKHGSRIHFVHLRNVISEGLNFHEANHLEGNVDMYSVVKLFLDEIAKRNKIDENEVLPMRPDHGHQMLDDLNKTTNPGYSAIGRLRGLAELRGLQLGLLGS